MSGRRDVAVLGLGAMGLPIAGRLASALEVVAFDVDPKRMAAAVESGAAAASSPAEAGAAAQLALLAVRTLDQAEEALFGRNGAAAELTPGATVVLTSTVGVAGARALGERCAGAGLALLDAPVSGGPARAADGDLLVFLGGSPGARGAAARVIELLASTAVVIGDVAGDGQAMKTVNQLLCGVHIAAAAEALALAQALGLDPRGAVETLGAGAAASFMLGHRGPRMADVLEGEEPPVLSRVDIFVKDMGLVAEAARAAGVSTPVAAAAEQLYRLADAAGLAADDDASIAGLLRRSDDDSNRA